MATAGPVKSALEFVKTINRHDARRLMSLATDDHRFVDALGQVVVGKGELERAWEGYFELFPDYRMSVGDVMSAGGVVGLFGSASGSFHRRNWEIPAAWRAEVKKGKVSEWRVYTDNEPVWKMLGVKRY